MAVSKATVMNALQNFKKLQDAQNAETFVAQEEGKGLSQNDFTDEYREKLDEIEPYTLPTASRWEKGGVLIVPDSGLAMSGDALIVTLKAGSDYTLPTASTTEKGGIKVGEGLSMDGETLNCTISSGTLDLVTHTQNGLMRATDKVKLDGIEGGAQVNAIERIFVNGTEQTVTSKSVDLDLSPFVKKTEIASGVRMKGSVNYFSDLPATAEVGDMYNIKNAGGVDSDGTPIEAGDNVVFTDKGTWDVMAGLIDLSGYAKLTDIAGLSNYTLPTASATEKGGVKIGTGLSMTGETLSATQYTLPTASTSTKGGVKVGTGLSMTGETLNCTVKGETYSEFSGATATKSGAKGLVPAPKTSDQKNFLCGDGTWADPSRFVHVVIGGGGSATAMSSSVSSIQGGLWQDLIDGTPCLKLRYGDYEYNFYYDTTNRTGDGSTPLDTTTKGVEYILSTVPSSEDGQLWYEVTNNHPTLMVHKWAFDYGYNYDTITYKGSKNYLYSYLPLEVTTDDACGNLKWTNSGATIVTAPSGGKALKNTGTLKASLSVATTWTVDFWFEVEKDKLPSNTTQYTFLTLTGMTSESSIMHPNPPISIQNKQLLFCTTTVNLPNERMHIAIVKTAKSSNPIFYLNGKKVATMPKDTGGNKQPFDKIQTITFFSSLAADYPAYIDHFRILE